MAKLKKPDLFTILLRLRCAGDDASFDEILAESSKTEKWFQDMLSRSSSYGRF